MAALFSWTVTLFNHVLYIFTCLRECSTPEVTHCEVTPCWLLTGWCCNGCFQHLLMFHFHTLDERPVRPHPYSVPHPQGLQQHINTSTTTCHATAINNFSGTMCPCEVMVRVWDQFQFCYNERWMLWKEQVRPWSVSFLSTYWNRLVSSFVCRFAFIHDIGNLSNYICHKIYLLMVKSTPSSFCEHEVIWIPKAVPSPLEDEIWHTFNSPRNIFVIWWKKTFSGGFPAMSSQN